MHEISTVILRNVARGHRCGDGGRATLCKITEGWGDVTSGVTGTLPKITEIGEWAGTSGSNSEGGAFTAPALGIDPDCPAG